MAKKPGAKKETKSDFLRKHLGKKPDLDHRQVNQRWTKTGHDGEISSALYYLVRAELGIKTEWAWVKASKSELNRVKPSGTPTAGRTRPTPPRPTLVSGEAYQLKVTLPLLDSEPPIWRRIQTTDCTLDALHEHIQTAMGWTNSHLHHFKIKGRFYGDPLLMAVNFDMLNYIDSTTTMLSEVVPRSGQRFRFEYEYDFGDGWQHEILFEGRMPAGPTTHYPLCLEGARACPPEDVGGIGGYAYFLEAIGDPNHEAYEEFKTWIGRRFNPNAFSPKAATRRMRRGLPNWREFV